MLYKSQSLCTESGTIRNPKVEKDEFVTALEEHVKESLEQSGKEGDYKIYIGEYEALYPDKVCISAAVTGAEKYYVRYLAVKTPKGNYYFWPVGFGLDGSLEECEAERHRMNKVCIENTQKLKRYVSEIRIEVGK